MSIPDQPNLPVYPASALDLFPNESRGLADPPFDVSRHIKYWKDTSQAGADPSSFVPYLVLRRNADGTWGGPVTIYMPAGEAATTNFPDPTPPNTVPARHPQWESPIRPLLPNEVIDPHAGLFTGVAMIRRTDFGDQPATMTVADLNLLKGAAQKILG